jgi:hypothetical protein
MTTIELYKDFEQRFLHPLASSLVIDARQGDNEYEYGQFFLTCFEDERIVGQIEAYENEMFSVALANQDSDTIDIIPYTRALPEELEKRNELYGLLLMKLKLYYPEIELTDIS